MKDSFVKDVFTHSVILDATMIIKVQKETYRGVCCKVNHCTVSLLIFSIQGEFYYQERHKYKELIIKHEKSSFLSTLKSLKIQHWQQEVKQSNLVFVKTPGKHST